MKLRYCKLYLRLFNTIQYNTIQYNRTLYNTIAQHSIAQYSIAEQSIAYNTIQYNTIQLQYNNTIQYNTKYCDTTTSCVSVASGDEYLMECTEKTKTKNKMDVSVCVFKHVLKLNPKLFPMERKIQQLLCEWYPLKLPTVYSLFSVRWF